MVSYSGADLLIWFCCRSSYFLAFVNIMICPTYLNGATTLSIMTFNIMTLSIMTHSITTHSITTLSITTLSITTLSITTLSIVKLNITISKTRLSA